ncbi:MAG: hypothetical protein GX219_01970 [Tissierellia bacterium]|mgnify:CR=1 FL=1|nr:hypothetical protein [Tissierellia bacterium]
MKRKLSLLLALLLISLSFAGCGETGKAYFKESTNYMKWDAIDQTAKVEMEMKVKGPDGKEQKINMLMDMDAYQVKKAEGEYASEITMDMSMNIPSSDSSSVSVNQKDIKMYTDGMKVYYPVSIFNSTSSLTGEQLIKTDKKYILMDVGSEDYFKSITGDTESADAMAKAFSDSYIKSLKKAMTNPMEYIDTFLKTMDLLGIDAEVKKEGNTYSYDIDGADLIKMLDSAVKNLPKNWKEIIKLYEVDKMLKDMPVDAFKEEGKDPKKAKEEAIEEFNDFMNSKETPEFITELTSSYKENREQVASFFKDVKVKGKNTLNKNDMKSEMELKMNFMDMIEMEMKVDSDAKKADVKKITMPKDSETISMEEFMKAMPKTTGKSVVVDIKGAKLISEEISGADIKIVKRDNINFYEMRKIVEALGGEVGYDKDLKKPFVVVDGNKKVLSLFVENGVSYINVEGLKSLGFIATENTELGMLTVIGK